MKILTILLLFITISFSNNKEASIEKFRFMFEKIGEKRVGVNDTKVDSIVIPFEKPYKPKTEEVAKEEIEQPVDDSSQHTQAPIITTHYNLQAIMGKRAKISGNWYKLNDKIDDYKIVSIKDGIVWLKNSMHKKRLTIRKKNEKITIK